MIRGLKILFRWLFILLFLFFAGLLIGGFVYQDELLEVVHKKLNNNIPGTIEYQSARLSLIRKFPMATVRFREVYLMGPSIRGHVPEMDTLAGFEKLFVQIHLLDLLKKKYAIHSLHADKGRLFLYTNEVGDPNYRYFLKNDQKGFSGFIDMQSMRITACRVDVINLNKKLEAHALLNRLDLKGTFAKDDYNLNSQAKFLLHSLRREGILFFSDLPASLNLDANVQRKDLEIKNGNLQLGAMKFNLKGKIQRGNKLDAGLSFDAENASLHTLVKILPRDHWVYTNFTGLSGAVTLQGKVRGRISPEDNPRIQLDFNMQEGGFRIPGPDLQFQQVSLTGSYDNGKNHTVHSTRIRLNEFNSKSSLGDINGSFTVYNLVKPEIEIQTSGKLDLQALKTFLKPASRIESLSGTGDFSLHARGQLGKWKFPDLAGLKALQWGGHVDLHSGRIKLLSLPEAIFDLHGRINLGPVQRFNELSFKLGPNDYQLTGRMDNLLEVLHGQGSLWIQVDLLSDYTDLGLVLNRDGTGDPQKGIAWPEKLHLKCKANIKRFIFNDFNVNNMELWFRYDPKRLQCYDLSFDGMSGQVKGHGEVIVDAGNHLGINTDLVLSHVDIQELFTAFNNFGQKVIQEQHLRGRLSGDLSFFARGDTTFRLQKESILAQADILIRDGALIGFEPLEKLSNYIELSELQQVSFSEIENRIIIRNSTVLIPEMEIESSALDMTLSGTHPFDNMYQYRVSLLLSDILFNQWKKKRENEDFLYIEETDVGKPVLFLSVQNTPEGVKISYDRKAAVDHFKEKMDEESRELKSILHEEFGMFRKDSLLRVEQEGEEQGEPFIIEWEEERDSMEEGSGREESHPRFEIEWEESPDSTLIPESIN